HDCCGAIRRTRHLPNRDSSNLVELNSRIAEIERDLRETATVPRWLSAGQPRAPVTFADSHVRTYSSPPPPTCDRTYKRTINTTNNEPNFNANIGIEIRDRRNYGNTDHASSIRIGTASHYTEPTTRSGVQGNRRLSSPEKNTRTRKILFKIASRYSGIPPSEWVRLIPDQLSESTSTWYKMVKSMSLTWDEFVIEFADRWDSPAIRSQLMAD
ncbi:SAP domain-containing protein, partial [Aphis craccivora]